MNINTYTLIKNAFFDNGEIGEYIMLDKSIVAYHKICSSLDKPLKLILFYGKPGSGKTCLLRKIFMDLEKHKDIIYLSKPFFKQGDFTKAICEFFTIPPLSNIDELLNYFKENIQIDPKTNIPSRQIILMLDESQLYPQDLLEKIRLMADTRFFKILFTVHKTEKEDALAKDHFKTRIWESIEFEPCTFDEIKMYIEKKLAFIGKESYFKNFTKNHLMSLWKYSSGNLRMLNKLLYKVYELLEYYEATKPSQNQSPKNIKKIIEMAGIDAGVLNA